MGISYGKQDVDVIDPYVGHLCYVYRELTLSPLYHLEEGIKEGSRNMYFCMM
jgi:hypothetical protein